VSQRHSPAVKGFWDKVTGSWQYVFHDPVTMKGAVVDPVWGFDPFSGGLDTAQADAICNYVEQAGIDVLWILDTHPHADHFSAAPYLKQRLGAPAAMGEHVKRVQALWKDIYNLDEGFKPDGSQWDRLFHDGEVFEIGSVPVTVLFSPGHTMASVTYVAGDAAFVHDTLMMPDSGTSRTDFPGGSSRELYRSIRRLLELPGGTRVFVGHDYAPDGREALCETTVADQIATNKHLAGLPSEEEFIAVRDARNATLPLPKLMLAALQVNIRGGRLPEPEGNGRSYLKIPIGCFQAGA
jgi:glyoxylase-like metal-dependent hydrolase (beta-lactamase superfamily II)